MKVYIVTRFIHNVHSSTTVDRLVEEVFSNKEMASRYIEESGWNKDDLCIVERDVDRWVSERNRAEGE